jgi:hypothetical protein
MIVVKDNSMHLSTVSGASKSYAIDQDSDDAANFPISTGIRSSAAGQFVVSSKDYHPEGYSDSVLHRRFSIDMETETAETLA